MPAESTTISQRKERKPRRDKLPPDEKHARHLEANRNYYARNRTRIQEEQRLRTRKRRQKLREEIPKDQPEITGIHRNVCPYCQCGRFPEVTVRETPVDDDDNGSVDDGNRGVDDGDDKDVDSDSEMGSNDN